MSASTVERTTRRARAEDVPALVALRQLMFQDMGTDGAAEPEWQDAARRWFARRVASPDVCLIVVEVHDVVVATAMGTLRDAAPSPSSARPGDVLISNVATAAASRRRGHARAAVDAVLEWAATVDVGRVELLATAEGQQMYLDAGFAPSRHPLLRKVLSGQPGARTP